MSTPVPGTVLLHYTPVVGEAIALILPIVGTFFLVFSVIEDTGYLPRLALLIDRIFKVIGLNGRAVIPMVLTLFVPCIAQFSVMIKERGLRTALAIFGFIFPFAFVVGFLLRHALVSLGVEL